MADSGEFRVAVKPSAIEANDAVRALPAERGTVLAYATREDAEAEAERLSRRGGTPLAVQRAAPQESDDVDAYLVPRPERRTHRPVESADGRLTFRTTAQQYGAIGEALVCCYGVDPPLLAKYVRDDLDAVASDEPGERLRVDLERDPDPVVYVGDEPSTRLAWLPDCVAWARDRENGAVLREYYCEIKTGEASFQRDQAAVMGYRASEPEATVLKIRLDVSGLPDRYTARIEEVAPEEPPATLSAGGSPDARLDDFA